MLVGIQPYNRTSNAKAPSINRQPSVLHKPSLQGKQIAFGDANLPSTYDYRNALGNLANEQKVIHGETQRDAFGMFFDTIMHKLDQKALNPGIDKIDKDLKISKSAYVDTMSEFIKERGVNLNPSDKPICDFLTVERGLKKPGFFDRVNPKFLPFFQMKILMDTTYESFIKKGLITFKNII